MGPSITNHFTPIQKTGHDQVIMTKVWTFGSIGQADRQMQLLQSIKNK